MLVEDLGFLGGLGTDPNNMIPLILLFTVGYLGLAPQPTAAAAPAATADEPEAAAAHRRQPGVRGFPGGSPARSLPSRGRRFG